MAKEIDIIIPAYNAHDTITKHIEHRVSIMWQRGKR